MGIVTSAGTISLDGYIAGPNETGFEHLFSWFEQGEHELPTADPTIRIMLGEADHGWMRAYMERIGAFLCGRRLFDMSNGWGGTHPMRRPVVVVTHSVPEAWVAAHPDAPITFVTDGVAAAVERAKAIAGDRDVSVSAGKITSQCLELGLLDEILLDLVPVLLGAGVPYFEPLAAAPILLDGPTEIVPGERVTHLRYTVRRAADAQAAVRYGA